MVSEKMCIFEKQCETLSKETMKRTLLLSITTLVSVILSMQRLDAQADPGVVVPAVSSYSCTSGSFALQPGATFRIVAGRKTDPAVLDAVRKWYAGPLALREVTRGKAAVTVKIDARALRDAVSAANKRAAVSAATVSATPGAYTLAVTPKGVTVCAADDRGAFYAYQTLTQMRDAGDGVLACCQAVDRPRFPHRGLRFDVVRHFRSKEAVKRQLDAMALVKMSRMHFHLTDNEGFRIALDCCPDVARKTAFGDARSFHDILSTTYTYTPAEEPAGYVTGTYYDDGKICGGYFSKDDIREIIAYAAERYIEVIPEIEMPGHNRALLTARPELFCTEHPRVNVVCVTQEETAAFFEAVLKEVAELFPSEYIHIGGDEADKANWQVCDRCRAVMEQEGLTSADQLQSRFIRRIKKSLNAMGKKLIGWDEILEGGLSDHATVMSWRGSAGGAKSLAMEHDVIMTPNTYYYFDYCQDAPYKEPRAFNACLPLSHVYSYDPERDIAKVLGDAYDPALARHILGVQANLWTECVITDAHFEYMLWPRAFAVAETGWSEAPKDYANFRKNSERLCGRLRGMGINTFDLSKEVGDRKAALQEIPRLTRDAKVFCHFGNGRTRAHVPQLADGHLGGWSTRDTLQWVSSEKGDFWMEMDLGKVQPVHYIGVEMAEYPLRKRVFPEKMEISVSADGVNYTPVPYDMPRWPDSRKDFQIVTFGTPVSREARFIRVALDAQKRSVHLSEFIVN